MTTFESVILSAFFAAVTVSAFLLSVIFPGVFYVGMIAAFMTVICIYAAITKEN